MRARRSSRRLTAAQVRVMIFYNHKWIEYKLLIHTYDYLIAEVAIGKTRLAAMEFVGTIFVTANWDDDWIGSVFSFQVNSISLQRNLSNCVSYVYVSTLFLLQDTSNFYLFMSSKARSNQGPWQIKRVSSITGPGSFDMTSAIT